jgi:hypothetical protein
MEGGPRSRRVARPLSFVSTALIRGNHRHAQHIVSVNGRRNSDRGWLDVVLCPVSTVSWMPIVRACLPPAVAHRPDLPACRASEVDEAAGRCNGDGGQPMTIFAGRLCADDRRVHIGRSSTLSSSTRTRALPRSAPTGFESGRGKATFCLGMHGRRAGGSSATRAVVARRLRFSVSPDLPSRAGGGSGRQRAST